ncbi:MAG: BBP7 family outer membrane beta-barrel protein, partial [Pirellulaceae bacterium]
THQVVNVRGNRIFSVPVGPPSTEPRGLLAQDSNSGIHENNEFTVVPELNLRYTQHLTECVDLSLGYTYIYWSRVAQPGDQVSLVIDDNPGGTQPLVNMVNDDYWIQSLDFGITWWF